MVNRCGSRSLAAAVAASVIRRRLAWGMVHGCMAGTGHGGHEGTWTLLGPLQGTDALAVGNLSLSFEHYGSQQSDQPRDLGAEACSEPGR